MFGNLNEQLESLVKTLTAGQYNAAPSTLVQGSALQIEDLSSVMYNTTFDDTHIKLQKMFTVKKSKSLLYQFNRQLSYGHFGGTAMREGAVGDVDVGDYIRATVPMCFYSTVRRVTLAANMVDTFDGKSGSDREAENAAMKIAGDVEFDMFRGKADFSNAGVFDCNPLAMPELPNMLGVECQVTQSDFLLNTQDLMFDAYGSNQSVVLNQNGGLTQGIIEDASVRSRMNMGHAELLLVDPIVLAGYNKAVALNGGSGAGASVQRIHLSGSAQEASGADLRRQWVSNATIALEDSRFLSGKTAPLRPTIGSPNAPATPAATPGTGGSLASATYYYYVTASNERGESPRSAVVTPGATGSGAKVTVQVANPGSGTVYYSVYRGVKSDGSDAKFIGRVKASAGATDFVDLGNRIPGFVTGHLVQKDTWAIGELAPYSRLKLAVADLSVPEASFRFLTLAGHEPRKNVLIQNLS